MLRSGIIDLCKKQFALDYNGSKLFIGVSK